MDKLDLYGGGFLTIVGLGLIFLVIPMTTEEGTYFGLPPTFFPRLTASGITLCAVALAIQAAIRLRAQGQNRPMPISWGTLGMFAILATTILVGIVVIDSVGMVIGAPLLIGALMLLLGERSAVRIVATSTVPVGLVYYLAIYILQTPVP